MPNYSFANIGNLKEASISIEPGNVNIKYGFNGIGKSTVIKALKRIYCTDKNEEFELDSVIMSRRDPKEPVYPNEIKNSFSELFVYDKNYFDGLFDKTDLLNGSYELLINDARYHENLDPVLELFAKIKNLITGSNYFQMTTLLSGIQGKELISEKNGRIVKTSTYLKQYAQKGIKIDARITKEIARYRQFICSGFRSQWSDWLSKAKEEWYDDDRCPFCGEERQNLSSDIKLLRESIGTKEYKDYDKEQGFVYGVATLISDDKKHKAILNINEMDGLATRDLISPLQEGLDFIKKEYEKVFYLLNLDGQALRKQKESSQYQSLKTQLSNNKLSEGLYLADNVDGRNLVPEINEQIDLAIGRLDSIKENIGRLESDVKKRIKDNEDLINDFLKISGIPYEVSINQEGDTFFNTLFKYKGDVNVIDHQIDLLSYGEANALALLLFCIEARKKDNCLIVLDDPVSSFDNNKRYAIYDYVFNNIPNRRLLFGKTCLLMTHDFGTVVVFSNSFPLNTQNIAKYSYLSLQNNCLTEEAFTKDDIINTVSIYGTIAKDVNRPKISRVVALRKLYEIAGDRTDDKDQYDMLSGLVHCRTIPCHNKEGTNPFSETEINETEVKIRKKAGEDFSYDAFLSDLKNTEALKAIYKSDSVTSFDKLCIARFLFPVTPNARNVENSVVWNFLSEVYHVETDSVYSINNHNAIDVPEYIIALCDGLLGITASKESGSTAG